MFICGLVYVKDTSYKEYSYLTDKVELIEIQFYKLKSILTALKN